MNFSHNGMPNHNNSINNNNSSYTTLPPIFGGSSSTAPNTRRSNSSRIANTNSTSYTRTHTSTKPPLPEFRKKQSATTLNTSQIATDVGKGGRRVGGGVGGGSGNDGVLIARRSSPLNGTATGDYKPGTARESMMKNRMSNHDTRRNSNHPHRAGIASGNGGEEATIGTDGTVTFGPNLSLMMASLSIRFDQTEYDEDGDGGQKEQKMNENGMKRRSGEQLQQRRSNASSAAATTTITTLPSRSTRKKHEWHAMNELYARAVTEKQTSKEHSQWFMSRFNYPILHQPQQTTVNEEKGIDTVTVSTTNLHSSPSKIHIAKAAPQPTLHSQSNSNANSQTNLLFRSPSFTQQQHSNNQPQPQPQQQLVAFDATQSSMTNPSAATVSVEEETEFEEQDEM